MAAQENARPAAVRDPRPPLARPPANGPQPAAEPILTPRRRVNVGVYEGVNRSVVNINTKTVRNDTFSLFEVPSEGAGSGSVLDTQGHILTNFHVVNGAAGAGHSARRQELRGRRSWARMPPTT